MFLRAGVTLRACLSWHMFTRVLCREQTQQGEVNARLTLPADWEQSSLEAASSMPGHADLVANKDPPVFLPSIMEDNETKGVCVLGGNTKGGQEKWSS